MSKISSIRQLCLEKCFLHRTKNYHFGDYNSEICKISNFEQLNAFKDFIFPNAFSYA